MFIEPLSKYSYRSTNVFISLHPGILVSVDDSTLLCDGMSSILLIAASGLLQKKQDQVVPCHSVPNL